MTACIQFGFFNKKLLLPFGIALFQILINIMNGIIPENPKNTIIEMIGTGLSEIAIIIIPLFNRALFKININSQITNSNKAFIHFFVLFLIFSSFLGLNIFISFITNRGKQNNKSYQNPHNCGLSTFESLELIFICLASTTPLKYKFFIHHIIFLIIFVLICISIDLIIDNFTYIYDKGGFFIILNIISSLIDGIDFGYQKYMIDVLFHSYWNISIVIGFTNLSIFSMILIACLIKGKEKAVEEKNLLFMTFYKYFEEVDIRIIILKQTLNFILNFFMNLCRILTIVNLTPDYILISFTISRIINIVIETKKYECLILFLFQFIILMFYLEILELKFCGLNKNTRRNILKREKKEIRWEERYDIVELAESISSESTN